MAPSRVRGKERDRQHDQPVGRKRELPDAQRRAQRWRRRQRHRIASPDQEADVGDDEGDAERDQHLALLVAREPAKDEPLHHDAEQSDAEPADDRR
jgi:hypothetical protein